MSVLVGLVASLALLLFLRRPLWPVVVLGFPSSLVVGSLWAPSWLSSGVLLAPLGLHFDSSSTSCLRFVSFSLPQNDIMLSIYSFLHMMIQNFFFNELTSLDSRRRLLWMLPSVALEPKWQRRARECKV